MSKQCIPEPGDLLASGDKWYLVLKVDNDFKLAGLRDSDWRRVTVYDLEWHEASTRLWDTLYASDAVYRNGELIW